LGPLKTMQSSTVQLFSKASSKEAVMICVRIYRKSS
jgi:hypothetical protein